MYFWIFFYSFHSIHNEYYTQFKERNNELHRSYDQIKNFAQSFPNPRPAENTYRLAANPVSSFIFITTTHLARPYFCDQTGAKLRPVCAQDAHWSSAQPSATTPRQDPATSNWCTDNTSSNSPPIFAHQCRIMKHDVRHRANKLTVPKFLRNKTLNNSR